MNGITFRNVAQKVPKRLNLVLVRIQLAPLIWDRMNQGGDRALQA